MSRAIWRSTSDSSTAWTHSSARSAESFVKSGRLTPATVTARDSGRRRAPPHSGHGRTDMYSSIFSRE